MSLAATVTAPFRYVSRRARTLAWHAQSYFGLLGRALQGSVTRPFYLRDLTVQLDVVGVGSIGIVLLTGLFTGMVLALQSAVELRQFGAEIYIGRLVGASAVRELGPVLTALMVTGRAGSGIAAELGAMRVTEQIDALKTMGVDPVRKLVVPRFLACLIALPLLTIITDLIAILGGLLIAVAKLDLSVDLYMRSVYLALAQTGFTLGFLSIDFVSGFLKPIVFGAIIAVTSCYFGLGTTGGTEGVGRAATGTVVTSSIFILMSDYFLTQLIIALLIE
ncbi:MAG: ABC transporter permease [Gemmatimonadota bacterium]|nr:ABC transporter permease [Gemmatimonadota bacterium]